MIEKALKQTKNRAMILALLFVFVLTGSGGIKAGAAQAAPAQVTGLRQTGSSESSITIEWDAVIDMAGLSDTYYRVELSMDGKTWPESLVDELCPFNSKIIGNLQPAKTYYVRVCLRDDYEAGNYGRYSQAVACVTEPEGKPEEIRTLAATADGAAISWDAVEGVFAYEVEYSPDTENAAWASMDVKATGATLKNLAPHTRHKIRVRAILVSGSGYRAEGDGYAEEYVYLQPRKVENLVMDGYWPTIGELKLTADRHGSSYNYEAELWHKGRKLDSSANGYSTLTSIWLEHPYINKYKILKARLRGYNYLSDGTKNHGEWSDWFYMAKQTPVKVKKTKKGIRVSWQKVDGADRYHVYMSDNEQSGFKRVSTTKKRSVTIKKFKKKDLKNGKTYYFKVVPAIKEGKRFAEADDSHYTSYSCKYRKK